MHDPTESVQSLIKKVCTNHRRVRFAFCFHARSEGARSQRGPDEQSHNSKSFIAQARFYQSRNRSTTGRNPPDHHTATHSSLLSQTINTRVTDASSERRKISNPKKRLEESVPSHHTSAASAYVKSPDDVQSTWREKRTSARTPQTPSSCSTHFVGIDVAAVRVDVRVVGEQRARVDARGARNQRAKVPGDDGVRRRAVLSHDAQAEDLHRRRP